MDEKKLTFYQYYPDKNIKDYVYYRSLLLNNPTLWGEVGGVLQQSLRLFSDELKQQSLDSLRKLYITERNKEADFLEKNDVTLKSRQNWDGLVKGFNEIYNSKNVFYRNIELIQKIGEGSNQGRIDIISNFQSYLKSAAYDFIQKIDLKEFYEINTVDFAHQVVKDAWVKMYSASDSIAALKKDEEDINKSIQAYSDLRDIFSQLDYNDSIFTEIIKEIDLKNFDTFLQKLREQGKGIKKIRENNLPNFTVGSKGTAGNLLEISTTAFLNSLEGMKGATIRTGQTLQKADLIQILNYDLDVDLSELQNLLVSKVETDDNKIRTKSIERIKKLYDNFTKGDIVFISDKNYTLTSKYFASKGGFSAQSKVTLSNLKGFFSYLNTSAGRKENIEDLIFVMANTGDKNFLNQDKSTIQRYLATKIAYFLFDDITITESLTPPDVNAIHIFNLDNIYIPLSVFLEAAYEGLTNINPDDYRRFVKVAFVPEPYQYKDQTDGLDNLDWETERKRREENSYITYHFFGDFVNFIKENINLIS